jgi:uncharacterized protein (DUF4415 family)
MKKDVNMKTYSTEELKALRAKSRTDWRKADALSDEELERRIAEDRDERDLRPDWMRARLVMPEAKQSIHLRLEREVIEFFKSQGKKGHIARMQAVLKAYADAHRPHVGQ